MHEESEINYLFQIHRFLKVVNTLYHVFISLRIFAEHNLTKKKAF